MTREDVIQTRIDEAKKEIDALDKKIMKEAKMLCDAISSKSLEKISEYKETREKLQNLTFELYVILDVSLQVRD